MHYAVTELNQSLEGCIWCIPLVTILLLMRQSLYLQNTDSMTLEDREMFDEIPFEEQLRRQQERFRQQWESTHN